MPLWTATRVLDVCRREERSAGAFGGAFVREQLVVCVGRKRLVSDDITVVARRSPFHLVSMFVPRRSGWYGMSTDAAHRCQCSGRRWGRTGTRR